jgi:hypothetical protein
MIHLFNKDNSIKAHDVFYIDKQPDPLRIVETTSSGQGVMNSFEVIKNLTTGKFTTISRDKLKSYNPYVPF